MQRKIMNKKEPLLMKQLNLNKVNCWIINLMPFPKDERYSSEVLPFQQECIKNNIFGMGCIMS